jgi:type IV pilus assembly protein PilV
MYKRLTRTWSYCPPTIKTAQRGFTLIEVLVAAVVLGIGLLGLAGLQAATVKLNQTSYLRSQASNLAYEITDAMRANRRAALSGSYDLALDATPSGSSLAASDLSSWLGHLQATLPNGQGSVAVAGDLVTVSIRWDSSRDADFGATTEFVFETRL